jgi:hypothetical protein
LIPYNLQAVDCKAIGQNFDLLLIEEIKLFAGGEGEDYFNRDSDVLSRLLPEVFEYPLGICMTDYTAPKTMGTFVVNHEM